jgi:hypothetical protein
MCVGTYGEVFVWNISAGVLNLQVIKSGLQRIWLVEHVNGDIESGQDTFGMGLELS